MNLKTTIVDGKLLEIVQEDAYKNNMDFYSSQSISNSVAIQINEPNDSYILPFRTKNDTRPGIFQDGSLYFIKKPEAEDTEYRPDTVVDFSDVTSIEGFLKNHNEIRSMESSILTDVDTIYTPPIGENDSPAMKLFKQAITSKRIDVNKYAPRFGVSFLNDMRILKTNDITLKKLVSMGNNFDIQVELTLRDKSSGVANPIGSQLSVILNDDGE